MFHLKTSFAHHFRIHGYALSLALKQTLVATRIRPIVPEIYFSFPYH